MYIHILKKPLGIFIDLIEMSFPTNNNNNNNNNKPNKEIAYISGLNHEKRRNELSKSIEVIEDFETRHLDDLFKVKNITY